MSLYDQFKTNQVLEEEGIIVRFKANDDGTYPEFKIGRMSRTNKRWLKTFEAKSRPYKRDIQDKVISETEAMLLNIEVFVESILQSWDNVQDENGKFIVFTKENAKKLFLDLPELFETLNEKAQDMNNFLEANLKDDEKN